MSILLAILHVNIAIALVIAANFDNDFGDWIGA